MEEKKNSKQDAPINDDQYFNDENEINNDENKSNNQQKQDENIGKDENLQNQIQDQIENKDAKSFIIKKQLDQNMAEQMNLVEAYKNVSLERKKKTFSDLKSWSSERRYYLDQQMNILNTILNRIREFYNLSQYIIKQFFNFVNEKNINLQENMKSLSDKKFPDFKQINQNLFSENQKTTAINDKTDKKDKKDKKDQEVIPVQKIIFNYNHQLEKCFEDLQDYQEQQAKKDMDFSKQLKQSILDPLSQEILNYQKCMESNFNILDLDKKKIQTLQAQVFAKGQKFTEVFNDMVNDKKTNTKDLYCYSIVYKNVADEESQAFQQAHLDMNEFYKVLCKLENTRQNLLKNSLLLFYDLQQKIYYDTNLGYANIQTANKISTSATESHFLNLKSYFSQEIIEKLQLKDVKQESQIIDKLLQYCDLPYKNDILIIKQIKANVDVGSMMTKKFEMCKLFYTIDNNLLIIQENKDQVNIKFQLKIKHLSFKLRPKKNENEFLVDLIEDNTKNVLSIAKKLLLKFDSNDELDEFDQTLKNQQRFLIQ